ncbi:trypsin-like peptidase domain-containing protein [Clavibacter michiganensis]|uniref:Pat-1 n=5 Tax=Clavibacter michiganensis TaxID=28447 RepID=Q9Z4J0_CLAMM|nr:trypsin-like peptidase domain-containing protein [Clavibacter michiganensis]AAD09893.2 unknown [Clavibacter michiganensis subsp. michiganensis]AHN16211.1 Pat-1 [Clavibacter michiganensis subsp. michiganensis]OQJ61494.1 serine protease [Clavibacter michiganensis subsp. michiganensis]CAM98538.1 pat-1 [Clavibacter michiganensis subsp. michiganensis NCPPB 382]
MQFMSRINRILFVAVVSLLSVLGCCVAAAPAQAVDRIARVSLPVRAGTHLIFSDSQGPARSADYDCTAGAVLTGSGILSRISPYQRAVRYVVTAKHCGGRGAHVRVGDVQVGSVIWESSDADLSIVRIEPLQTTRRSCYPTSAGIRCTLVNDYEPRASGEVFGARNRSGQESSVQVAGTKVPADREIFCTSGAITGILCNWVSAPPPRGLEIGSHQVVAETFSAATRQGDSGGPVVSRDMKIIGVICDGGLPGSGDDTYMSYLPISVLFREQPYYILATS